MLKKIISATIIASAASASTLAQADVSATVTLVSDYVYNGVSSNDNDPTLQGSVDWYNDAGFYAGIWASAVNFDIGTDEEIEIDYYFGHAGSLTETIAYDVGYALYTYPGADSSADYDYGEIYGALTFNESTTAKLLYSDNYSGDVGNSIILELSHTIALPEDFSLRVETSHTELLDEDRAGAFYGPNVGDNSYNHWGLAVGKSLAGFDMELAYTDTNIDEDHWGDTADSRLVFSIGRTF